MRDTNKFLLIVLSGAVAACSGDRSEPTEIDDVQVTEPPAAAAQTRPDADSAASFPTRVYWGDTHNHTGNSFDVYLFGTPTATPETAYRFARGEAVENPATGTEWQLRTPLDFLVVADHAEMLGAMPRLYDDGDEVLTETKAGQAFLRLGGDKSPESLLRVYHHLQYANDGVENDLNITGAEMTRDLHAGDKRQSAWERYIDTTEEFNDPGTFTTLIGWEWTSTTRGANLHRVVFMKEGGDVARQFIPYSTFESDDPEDLWTWLDETSERVGADFVAIPHNSNISDGRMFPLIRSNGEAVDATYGQTRMRWEPVVEVTQIKGDSEAHPALSPTDEFADYETYLFVITPGGKIAEPNIADYARSGLMRGLELGVSTGANPYKFGMIGATDTHTGIAAVDEDNFSGKGQKDAKPENRHKDTGLGLAKGWDMGAAGFAGVWATENTREALVDAFKRKEVYATTGPRITLRFFGGFDFTAEDAAGDIAAAGYSKGVPMGSDLVASGNRPPTLLAWVAKDPNSANLDRLQIIKGWVDSDGEAHERIYDIAVAGDRTIGDDGRARESVGNTVDLETGEYTNTIGATQLVAMWTDPDFDPTQAAFYYVRALEIPTPRYSLLNAIELGINWQETGRPATIQERVYSSPIWFNP